jgi:hypothetical protein
MPIHGRARFRGSRKAAHIFDEGRRGKSILVERPGQAPHDKLSCQVRHPFHWRSSAAGFPLLSQPAPSFIHSSHARPLVLACHAPDNYTFFLSYKSLMKQLAREGHNLSMKYQGRPLIKHAYAV